MRDFAYKIYSYFKTNEYSISRPTAIFIAVSPASYVFHSRRYAKRENLVTLYLGIPLYFLFSFCFSYLSHADQTKLVQSDLKLISNFNERGPINFDKKHEGIFKAIFGGYSGKHIKTFITERIRYFLPECDVDEIVPSTFTYPTWISTKESAQKVNQESTESKTTTIDYSYTGSNDTAQLWILGKINQVPVKIRTHGKWIPGDNLNAAFVVLGPGYAESIPTKAGVLSIPIEYRIGKLIHEARHSECFQEVSNTEITQLKKTKSYEEFRRALGMCGYLHSLCQSTDRDLKDQVACESTPWGPYSLEAIFFDALKENFPKNTKKWKQFDLYSRDAKRRLNFSYEDLVHFKLGPFPSKLGKI